MTAIGLTDAEVAARLAEGKSNDIPERATRRVAQIVRANVFTRINAILGVLLLIVLATGSVINGMFGLLIIANSIIGMIQELRAKQTLDNLAILGQAKPLVRRQSGTRTMSPSEVVLDDVIELGPGDQVVVDGEVLEQDNLEIDESLLTGEADSIAKHVGEQVMSGSFVVAGSGAYRATKVGHEAYAAKLAAEASKFTLVKSELRSGINKILQLITYLLIPAGLLTIYTQLFTTHAGWRDSVLRTVGALVPMVPEGLVLITSIAFAVGVVRLGQRQCLVQELPAIEGLARVDVVCADKTGTLTETGMRVSDVDELIADQHGAVADVLAFLAAADARPNASMQAIAQAFPSPPDWTSTATAPFKSATKWSGISFRDHGNWVIGAPDVLLDSASEAAREAERIGHRGCESCFWGRSRGGGRSLRTGPGNSGRLGDSGAESTARCARNDGVLCRSECFGEGHLWGQRGIGRRGRRQARVAGPNHGCATAAIGAARVGRRPGYLHHFWAGAAGPEARHSACAAVPWAHGGDDRRRGQRCIGPQRCRYRRGDGNR
ncbi:HAD ATPase, P-type, IC family protein [Mycobacterium ulcerans str. Harvey]|uniref:HAD ATPase, P-type, IC family protein n=1 Tax=Mycobacterium ulcerans str. Harvey TaxID=1299332 RepID=A0ABN0R798_MYCUL|nr:HAD ATPase, P-type, IC family protein [Mycobacterium ulcerans str. Harvey]